MSKDQEQKYFGRSAQIVEMAKSAKSATEVIDHLKGMFVADIIKALKYAETNLEFAAVKYLSSASEAIGFHPEKAETKLDVHSKYSKRLELKFNSKINADYKAFIQNSLEKDGVLVSIKGDVITYAFEAKKFERIVARVRPLSDVVIL
jgi:hypothetical protein